MQHQLTKMIPRGHKLSAANILPKAAVKEKKATLGGTLAFHMFFHGKEPAPLELSYL